MSHKLFFKTNWQYRIYKRILTEKHKALSSTLSTPRTTKSKQTKKRIPSNRKSLKSLPLYFFLLMEGKDKSYIVFTQLNKQVLGVVMEACVVLKQQ
jgi:hypothetical protein